MLQCINLVFIITAINDIGWYGTDAWCQLNGFTNLTFLGRSLLTLTLISTSRYFVIVKDSNGNFFIDGNTLTFTFFTWFYSLMLAVTPLAGWSEYIFHTQVYSCWSAAVRGQGDISYDAVVIAILAVIPFNVLSFCSWKILMVLRRSRRRIEVNISSMSARNEGERRVTR